MKRSGNGTTAVVCQLAIDTTPPTPPSSTHFHARQSASRSSHYSSSRSPSNTEYIRTGFASIENPSTSREFPSTTSPAFFRPGSHIARTRAKLHFPCHISWPQTQNPWSAIGTPTVAAMSWYKDILTNASTNITKLQRTYFAGDADGDTEDDTHVCRVLRSYYTEKGQPFPGWLPPDPKAPPPAQPVYAQPNQVGSRYGGFNNPQQAGGGAPSTGSGRLGSLWDNNNSNQAAQPASLRQGRANPFAARGGREETVQSRPLPSQRGGSYQQTGAYGRSDTTTPPGSTAAGGSAQDKLKQRLWGGSKTTSPSSSAGPFQPPSQPQQSQQPQGGSRWGNSGGGSGGGNYEDRFAPAGASVRNDKPVMSANAPWAGGDMDYYSGGPDYSSGSGGGGGGGSSGRNRPAGLPSGPRKGGLPSGPRMR